MTEKDLVELINKTVTMTVLKLRMAGLIKDDRETAFQKTEEVLRNYPQFLKSDQPYARKLSDQIESALDTIRNDCYYEIIPMAYFERQDRETIAEYFDVTVTTISRNKIRLVNKLKAILFSDEVIYELFL